jgi:hypothetical protein
MVDFQKLNILFNMLLLSEFDTYFTGTRSMNFPERMSGRGMKQI